MKKNSLLIIILLLVLVVTGCEEKKEESTTKTTKSDKIDSIDKVSSKKGTLECSRLGSVENGDANFSYTVNYKNDIILYVHSVESVTIEDENTLKQYENAYKEIKSHYDGLKYYDISVKKDGNTVTNTINIDYERVNIQDIIDIEGEEDNIYENNKPMLSKWLDLAKKMGVSCHEK